MTGMAHPVVLTYPGLTLASMTDEAVSLILEHLRALRAELVRVGTKADRIYGDVRDMRGRLTSIDESLAGVNRRIDRMEGRPDRSRAASI